MTEKGFTIIEVLVVLLILAILGAVAWGTFAEASNRRDSDPVEERYVPREVHGLNCLYDTEERELFSCEDQNENPVPVPMGGYQ